MKSFLCEYLYEGELYGIEISANSIEEARKRLAAISAGAVLGEIKGTVPYGLGWAAKIWVATCNFFRP